MPDIHWFTIDEISNYWSAQDIKDWATDDGDENADEKAQERLLSIRQAAEDEAKDRISPRYDPTQFDVDADGDGISDNLPARLKLIAIWIFLWILSGRRGERPTSINENYTEVNIKLARIVSGADPLFPQTSASRISGNMTEADLGHDTQNGGTEALLHSEMI